MLELSKVTIDRISTAPPVADAAYLMPPANSNSPLKLTVAGGVGWVILRLAV